jgi:predicted dehydrogenase
MAPIRVGFIGLSAIIPVYGLHGEAVRAHLPSLVESPYYEIIALANSSVEAAHKSTSFQNFPPTTKAYVIPDDLAERVTVHLV